MTSVGLVTIGQAPRDDVTPSIAAQLPEGTEIIEAGALDPFASAEEIRTEVGARPDGAMFVTRLQDGTAVDIDRSAAHELLQERIEELEDRVMAIGVLCTGAFPDLTAAVPILEPRRLLRAWVAGITQPDDTLGIVMPDTEQIQQTIDKWDEHALCTAAGSPYAESTEIDQAAMELGTEPDLVVMDCIGYDSKMERTVRKSTDASVLLSRSVLAKTLSEIL